MRENDRAAIEGASVPNLVAAAVGTKSALTGQYQAFGMMTCDSARIFTELRTTFGALSTTHTAGGSG